MQDKAEKRKGEIFVFVETFLFSFFPIITILTYKSLPSLISLGYSTIIAAIFFAFLLWYKKTWREILNPLFWKHSLYIAFFNGFLFSSFYFIGLTKTTAGNASIIALFEVFTTFLLFHVFKKDIISSEYKLGALLMVVGAVIILGVGFGKANIGDFFILLATFCPPIGNYFQQKLRKVSSGEAVLFLRSLLSFPMVFFLAYLLNQHASFENIKSAWVFLLINGFVMFFLCKLLWVESIHRISVTKAIALESLAPFMTLLFGWILLTQTPHIFQFISLIPLFFGTLLLTDNLKFKK